MVGRTVSWNFENYNSLENGNGSGITEATTIIDSYLPNTRTVSQLTKLGSG
jgi:hypothetical protein